MQPQFTISHTGGSPTFQQLHFLVLHPDAATIYILHTGGSVGWALIGLSRTEVVSSTPAGPTLRVLTCCLCNYINKRLDFQVFSDKDYKPEVVSQK